MTHDRETEATRTGTGGQEGTKGRATAGPRYSPRLAAAADPEEVDSLMTLLKNGSTLLVESLTPNGEAVVLAITPEGAFATWRKDGEGNTYSGDYYPPTLYGLTSAIASLERRAGS